ncbi:MULTISPECIES: hypothetical protein [unclassified Leptolyngbya]|uniref:hypothetical protein n=1 Tax=unclassified Leptolyngbya TaxID=2650499 RepID=UPI001685F8CD|nr:MULTISPECIES: hypothetical protein [unclassified Leptolyngbya]MBD1910471.1 hypothetical protein [Leptolyngbya sp. FACHB-8]MBD2153638.1 hypothetical protein [Leptolyngbya sp. FACHB-16]
MSTPLERSAELKQALLDFVFDAEGDVAVALESFTKAQLEKWSKSPFQGQSQSTMAMDMFITEGNVGNKTPIDCFMDEYAELTESDRQLLTTWHRSFNGLFQVMERSSTGYELMNWLTTKRYQVLPNGLQEEAKLSRLKPGEILVTRISPLSETEWIFSGPMELLGMLGKPKLAVAIGNFKDKYRQHLYGDAPELLEEAWQSVEKYHQEFADFFGSSEVTLPGYEFEKKFKEFQEILTKKQLEQAGIDGSKSLKELAEESGLSPEEMEEMTGDLGEAQAANQLLNSGKSIRMIMPKVELPKPLQRAEHLTAMLHPRWGASFLEDYQLLRDRLSQDSDTETEGLDKQIKKYLEDATINPYIWQNLAKDYPKSLENALRRVLQKPDFDIQKDLQTTLESYGKPAEPELPEIASVPLHLNDLFQEALAEVNRDKNKGKSKAKQKAKTGFGVR